MSILTSATRMWLTKSTAPFEFKNEYDKVLEFKNLNNLGLYIHIPFCNQICTFCPYCKEKYSKDRCDKYIDALIKEIHMVGKTIISDTDSTDINKKKVTSLYFGGGTPALAIDRLEEILNAVNKYFIITEGIGLELHPRNVTINTLEKLKQIGITKLSIGIQSFNDKFLEVLDREKTEYKTLFEAINKVKFETVSMDFIFALPNQTIDDLKDDINEAFNNAANHIAIYPFIDFSFTDSQIKPMSKKEKRKLLDDITIYCEEKGYHRDSIWTFSNNNEAKYSSMTRDNFLGFGCSATTLLKEQFKINTFSVDEYINRINNQDMATSLTIRFTKRQRMIYYLFWTAYTTSVDGKGFYEFFGENLEKYYGFELWIARVLGFIKKEDTVYKMTLKGAFYYHYYENFYTLAYIDKMWGIMKEEAFPEKIKF